MKRTRFAIPLLILLLFFSCGDREDVISEELYTTIFTELVLLNQMNEERFSDSEKQEIKGRIFEHYNITEEEFAASHDFYESQNREQIARMDSISVRLRAIRGKIDQAQREFKQQQDSLRQREEDNL